MMATADNKVTVMLDDATASLISKVSFRTDRNRSEIIRACILLSIDSVAATPSLVHRISVADREDYRELTGK